jgi:hypothetical protein
MSTKAPMAAIPSIVGGWEILKKNYTASVIVKKISTPNSGILN